MPLSPNSWLVNVPQVKEHQSDQGTRARESHHHKATNRRRNNAGSERWEKQAAVRNTGLGFHPITRDADSQHACALDVERSCYVTYLQCMFSKRKPSHFYECPIIFHPRRRRSRACATTIRCWCRLQKKGRQFPWCYSKDEQGRRERRTGEYKKERDMARGQKERRRRRGERGRRGGATNKRRSSKRRWREKSPCREPHDDRYDGGRAHREHTQLEVGWGSTTIFSDVNNNPPRRGGGAEPANKRQRDSAAKACQAEAVVCVSRDVISLHDEHQRARFRCCSGSAHGTWKGDARAPS